MQAEIQPDFDWGKVPERLRDGFEEYHRRNPHIYDKLVGMARAMKGRGHPCSIGMFFEVLRYRYNLKSDTDEPFVLNNSYRSFYVRLIEQNHPELRGAFRKRRSIADYD